MRDEGTFARGDLQGHRNTTVHNSVSPTITLTAACMYIDYICVI